jgi:alkylated DNA repair dioxygenase AlkB
MVAVKYKLIKNFFNQDELKILDKYCYNKLDHNKDYVIDDQSFSPAWYNDPLMNGLLDLKLPLVEKESTLNLSPTYAYWRYYVFGATLAKHIDRPACEISVTACIKKFDNWPIVVEGTEFELEEGDAVLYAGCDQKHWRPGTYKGEGMAQVFFHYVNKLGPNKDHAYDNINKIFKMNKK